MYDIIFISNNEPNADQNWFRLHTRFPTAKRINGIVGIHAAHKTAAKAAFTKMFWAVDGDAYILDTFNFDYQVPEYDQDVVHIFHSVNPINDLKYGYGGVKLLPRKLTQDLDEFSLDMTLAISNKIKVVKEVSNLTHFNTDFFNTWKSAFREAVKLTCNVKDQIDIEDSQERLESWMTKGQDKPFGGECLKGARAGNAYALSVWPDKNKLKKINDFTWLKDQFNNV